MKHFILAALIGISAHGMSQAYSNMPFSNSLAENPALTGLTYQPKLDLLYKHSRNFNSYYAGYSQYSDKLKGGLGVYVYGLNSLGFTDFQMNRSRIGLSYAFQNSINSKWHYSLGAAFEFSGSGYSYDGETEFSFDLGFNIGGMLFTDNFFTSLKYGQTIIGRGEIVLRTGYKWQPFQNEDFSITPILTYKNNFNNGSFEANLNISYKNMHLNLGHNYGGLNLGLGYDFKRFRLNYNVGSMFETNVKSLSHEIGVQFKLKSKNDKASKFNHNLF